MIFVAVVVVLFCFPSSSVRKFFVLKLLHENKKPDWNVLREVQNRSFLSDGHT